MFSNLISVFTPTTEPAVDAGPSTLVIKSNDINVTLFTEAKLVKMRERFPGQSDDTLARYLIARKDDYELACAQLDRAISWRAAHYPILKSTFMKELSTGKLYVRGVDKEGRPLLIYRSRLSFPKTRDLEECARMNIWFVEHIKRLMPNNMTKYTLLVDRTEHTSENTDIELMKHLSASVADLFPESLSKAIIYPADVMFYSIWAIAKWFVDPVTREKTQMMMYLSGVEQFIDREHIPKSMGGDDDYEYSPDHFEDPYSAEELAQFDAARSSTTASDAPQEAEPIKTA